MDTYNKIFNKFINHRTGDILTIGSIGINGVLLPTNSGANIGGVNRQVEIYNSDGATNAQHQLKSKVL